MSDSSGEGCERVVAAMLAEHNFPPPSEEKRALIQRRIDIGSTLFRAEKAISRESTLREQQKQAKSLSSNLYKIIQIGSNSEYIAINRRIVDAIEVRRLGFDFAEWLQGAQLVHEHLAEIAESEVEYGARQSDTETVWIGEFLPATYRNAYSGRPFGGSTAASNNRTGPGFTFVRVMAIELGIARHLSGQRIHEAMRAMKKRRASGANSG